MFEIDKQKVEGILRVGQMNLQLEPAYASIFGIPQVNNQMGFKNQSKQSLTYETPRPNQQSIM
jgi:hypothetical protein